MDQKRGLKWTPLLLQECEARKRRRLERNGGKEIDVKESFKELRELTKEPRGAEYEEVFI